MSDPYWAINVESAGDLKMAKGLEELGIPRQAGPRERRSLHAAQAIFDNIAEIEQLAGEQGQLYQDYRAERYEWCRLVAMVIEVYFKSDIGVNDDGNT